MARLVLGVWCRISRVVAMVWTDQLLSKEGTQELR